jgi:hypothetical protein
MPSLQVNTEPPFVEQAEQTIFDDESARGRITCGTREAFR